MKVLLDECVDSRLVSHITTMDVSTVAAEGWGGNTNGQRLSMATAEFVGYTTVVRYNSYFAWWCAWGVASGGAEEIFTREICRAIGRAGGAAKLWVNERGRRGMGATVLTIPIFMGTLSLTRNSP